MGNQFFIYVFVTVLIIRILIWLKPIPGPTFFGFRTHHYMYGLAMFFLGILIKNIVLAGMGFGLFLDELTYILMGGKTHQDNYSFKSLFGTFVFLLALFIFRNIFVKLFI